MMYSRKGAVFMAVAATTMIGCNTPDSVAPVDHSALHVSAAASSRSEMSVEKAGLANAVKAQVARFHSLKQAENAGYTVGSPCISIPVGGMGYHYVKAGPPDNVFDPMQPEALVYAPDEQGNLKLVAVEYIVANTNQTAPTFDGEPFNVGGTPFPAPHWSLHVWLFKNNPLGMFAPFNPDVTCPAPEA